MLYHGKPSPSLILPFVIGGFQDSFTGLKILVRNGPLVPDRPCCGLPLSCSKNLELSVTSYGLEVPEALLTMERFTFPSIVELASIKNPGDEINIRNRIRDNYLFSCLLSNLLHGCAYLA